MKLDVFAVGTHMPAWVTTAWQDYAHRLPRDCPVTLHEVRAAARTQGRTREQLLQAEARHIERTLPSSAWLVVLDERGRDLTTQALAQQMRRWRDDDLHVAFLIGGPDGVDAQLKARARQMVRLSSLTLPHAMVRVLLIEQLYRAWTILQGHPYHRA